MVLLAESRAASGWFGRVRRTASGEKASKERSPLVFGFAGLGTVGAAERAFDIAEVMEEGRARELVSGYMQPLPVGASLFKFQVERSDSRLEYRLYCNEGEFLMYAKVCKSDQCVRLFLYDPCGKTSALHDPSRPAFTLRWNEAKTEWRLVQQQSDDTPSPKSAQAACQEQQEVLSVQHSWQSVGDGVNLCMDIYAAATPWGEEQWLTTKPPEWNKEVESLVMDFEGRKIMSSAKNFQLAREDSPQFGEREIRQGIVCQHGKIKQNTFALDFEFPLSIAQAFAVSLTTLFWV